MRDDELLRYNRQIMLPELDVAGQQRLLDASVLVLGMGGLGCPAAMYLAAAGVGHLLIADDDEVELSNLQRQVAHGEDDIGRPKVASAADTLRRLNPHVQVTTIHERLNGASMESAVSAADLVVDACDNFSTRFELNRQCVALRRPLVSGAAIRMEGQVAVFDRRKPSSPCYQCLYGDGDDADASCATNGVMAPLVGIVGAIQAMEAIKVLSGVGQPLLGRLLLLDARTMQWREMRLPRDPHCAVCSDSQFRGE